MPEEIDDFEEIEEVEQGITNDVPKTSKNKDNIIDFNKKKQELNANKSSHNMPTRNISDMPQGNMSQANIPQNNSKVEPKKDNIIDFNKNKKKMNNNEKNTNDRISSNTTKKSDNLPLNKKKKTKDGISNNNSSSNKVGRKRFQTPIRRNNISEADGEDKNKDIESNNDSNNKSKDQKNKLSNKKNGIKSKLDKLKHPGQSIKQGAKNIAAEVVKKVLKPIKIKIMTSIGALVGGLAVCFFVIYLILSPLMDIWPYIDGTVRAGSNFTEKFLNFFRGFGFEDSKEAFYTEAESLNKFYDNSLDMPLLLSTLFYPEIQNYNMDYEEHLAVDNNDPVTSLLSGGPTGFVSFVKNWIKDAVVNESNNTYDENGLVYNANKIYRMRRLAAAMADRDSSTEKTVSLKEFLLGDGNSMGYAGMFGKALKDFFSSVISGILDIIKDIADLVINEFLDLITFDFEAMKNDFDGFVQSLKDTGSNIIQAFSQLINVVSFGFCTITSISFAGLLNPFKDSTDAIKVTYKPYKFNKENYDQYIKDYYFENTIEYAKLLPDGEPQRTNEKNRLLSEIYTSKETFEEIFLDITEGEAEEYVDNCQGAINNNLVKELALPIKTTSGQTFNMSDNELFGIHNGIKQNGVVLTKNNSGINSGDEVYSIADGTIVEVHHSTDKEDANSIGGKTGVSNINAGKSYSLTEEQLKGLASQCQAEQGSVEGAKAEASLMANRFELYGSKYSSVYDYVRNSGWFANSKKHMDNETPRNEILEAVRDVLINGNRTLPGYVDEHDCYNCNKKTCNSGIRGDICSLTNPDRVYTDISSITNRSNYISQKTVIKNKYGATYTFYSFPTDRSDPFGYTQNAYNKVTGNEQRVAEQSSNYVTIKHEIVYNNGQNKDTVYTIYKYLGNISNNIKVGDRVSKGQVIGTVGNVFGYSDPSLYFEFQNSSNTPINPNNLFIKCAGAYDVIWPCSNSYISDMFGDRSYEVRNHLGSYGSCATTSHIALDINETGPFYAVGNGTIQSISKSGVHTITLKLDTPDQNGNTIYVNYVHGDAASGLKVGQHLKTGEKVGTANGWGRSGPRSYGVHLHFEVYTLEENKKIYHNPLMFLYGLNYDGTNDGKMSCDIPKYDGSKVSEITFWKIRPEERNFAAEFATIGNYNSSRCDYENPKFWKNEVKN